MSQNILEEKNKHMNKETSLEHYKEELKEIFGSIYGYKPRIASVVKSANGKNKIYIPTSGDSNFIGDILDWMAQPYEEPILDNVEKAYLRSVIKPFKDKTLYIYKTEIQNEKNHYIRIVVKSICDGLDEEEIAFPLFKKNTMYKGMELDKQYTLKELGL